MSSDPEVCWEEGIRGASSGGFSNYWARPSYQNTAVETYFKSGTNLPEATMYNRTGAGFPDVAAQASNYVILMNSKYWNVSGTSLASPAFTAIIGLVNEARLAVGKRSLGYLNPLIYKVLGPGGAFNDITSGSNPGCGTSGFHAAPGWDPVTGFGTPNYEKIVTLVMKLP